jgi:hypothetical protein
MITVGGRSQTFAPGDIDSAASSASATAYVKTSGATTDSLTLTKPGTSGPFTYQFVGGGYWQRTVDAGTSFNGSFDAFAYGLPTASASVPRSGRGEYQVDLLGAASRSTGVTAILGSGYLHADFGQGLIVTAGAITSGPANMPIFSGQARLASGNAFNGAFRIGDNFWPGALDPYVGTWNGRFYGPNAQEVGAAFSANDPFGGAVAGSIVGRGTQASATNATVNPPTVSGFFSTDHVGLSATLAVPYPVDVVAGAFTNRSTTQTPLTVAYDAASNTYSVMGDTWTEFLSIPEPVIGNPFEKHTFLLKAPIAGRYVSVAYVRRRLPGASIPDSASSPWSGAYAIDYFAFGAPTADTATPRTGAAGYALKLIGTAANTGFNSLLDLSGEGLLTARFDTGVLSLDGYVDYREDYNYLTHPQGAGRTALSGSGQISSTGAAFTGNLSFSTTSAYSGAFNGRFYGPAADEMAATFTASDASGNLAAGALFGARHPGAGIPAPTLLTLPMTRTTQMLVLAPPGQFSAPVNGGIRGVTVDALTSTYAINFGVGTSGPYTLNATVDPVALGGDYLVFTPVDAVALGPARMTGKVLRSGGGTAPLILSYASFMDLSVGAPSDLANFRHLTAIFGLPTTGAQIPLTGTASYVGKVFGSAFWRNAPSDFYSLSGDSQLAVNFGTGAFDITMTAVAHPDHGGHIANLDPIRFSGAIGAGGVMTNTGSAAGNSFTGQFFGPEATEFGAAFETNATARNVIEGMSVNGVTLGKRP